jgi:glycosyltransferase involved in cell wall biosynthesis
LARYHSDHQYYLYTPEFKDQRVIDWLNEYPSFNVRTPESTLAKKAHSIWRSFGLSGTIEQDSLDLYHGLSHEIPFGLEKKSCKKVVTIHDLLFMRFPENFGLIDRKMYRLKFSHGCEKSDQVLAICDQTKRDIVDFLGIPESKITVMYQSCEPMFYQIYSDEAKEQLRAKYNLPQKYMLYVGAIEPNKNALTIIRAYGQICSDVTEDLVLVGKGGKYKEKCKNLVRQLGIENRVRFLDELEYLDLPGIYQLATLLLHPSFFEGFGIPIIEALFSLTPALITEGHCFPEAGGEDSIYLNPNKVDDWSDAMKLLAGDEDLCYRIANKSRNFVEKFHQKQTSKKLMEFYQSLLSNQ